MELYRTVMEQRAASGAAITVESDAIPDFCDVKVLSAVAVDMDNIVATSIEIGVKTDRGYTPMDITNGPFPVGISSAVIVPFVAKEGERIYAKFSNATANDKLVLVVNGELHRRSYIEE